MKNYPFLLPALANTIERIRKEKKLTKLAVACNADLQDCYLRGITKGKRNPTISAVYLICDALDIRPIDFFQQLELERASLSKAAEPAKK